ncbi:A24 family peptidase [Enterobacter cancerogenus]
MYLFITFIFGVCMGSFSNVVIYRIPIMMSRTDSYSSFNLFLPRSHCPQCQHILSPLELIPLLGWIFLQGKCSECHCRISARYPAMELLHGVGYCILAQYIRDPFTAMPLCFFINALIIIAVIDYRHFLIPDMVTIPLVWTGLLWNGSPDGLVDLHQALYGAVAGYLSLWVNYWLYYIIRKREGLGYGDMKLGAALGAWLGAGSINVIMLVASVVGLCIWLVRRNTFHDKVIPFGPALCFGGVLYLLLMDSQNTYWRMIKIFI